MVVWCTHSCRRRRACDASHPGPPCGSTAHRTLVLYSVYITSTVVCVVFRVPSVRQARHDVLQRRRDRRQGVVRRVEAGRANGAPSLHARIAGSAVGDFGRVQTGRNSIMIHKNYLQDGVLGYSCVIGAVELPGIISTYGLSLKRQSIRSSSCIARCSSSVQSPPAIDRR
jgi:hypothetical protein